MYIIAEKIKMKASTGVVAMAAVREKDRRYTKWSVDGTLSPMAI